MAWVSFLASFRFTLANVLIARTLHQREADTLWEFHAQSITHDEFTAIMPEDGVIRWTKQVLEWEADQLKTKNPYFLPILRKYKYPISR